KTAPLLTRNLPYCDANLPDDAGMRNLPHPSDPLPLPRAARCLGVPPAWLRDEIDAGRLPALIAGKAVLVHVPTVAQLLGERAKRGEGVDDAR
ncbi:MAG: hypothetical protein AAF593_04910, partial [Planctomycetota bacterium]